MNEVMELKETALKRVLIIFVLALFNVSCSDISSNEGDNNTGTQLITFPGNFSISAVPSINSLTLSWTPLSEIAGATSYELFKGDTKLKSLTLNDQNYVDTGLAKDTFYAYRIKAINSTTSKLSPNFSFVTLATVDNEAPGIPANLASVASYNTITLSWEASTDNVGVASYEVYRNGNLLGTTNAVTLVFEDSGLDYASSFSYAVLAVDGSGNKSALTSSINVATLLDNENPTTPSGLTSVAQATEVELRWDKSTDNHTVSGYKIFRDDVQVATVSNNYYRDIGLNKSQTYTYKIIAFDFAGNDSAFSQDYPVTTTNSNLRFKAFPSQINLSWADSVNNTPVTYKIHRDSGSGFQLIASTQLRGYQDVGLTENTNYTYKITYGAGDTLLPLTETDISTIQRKIKLQVYEKSGNYVSSFPVQAFVPLPYGVYKQSEAALKDTFVLKDSLGNAVEAQYWVRSRWHAKDNSIKEMVVVFKAKDIPANAGRGQNGDPVAVEYFLEHGTTPAPANPVSVIETANGITISNANISFEINKNNFNFINSATFKGTPIINNGIEDGSYLVNLYDNTYLESQPCTNKTPTVFEVEESGPVRARIRVERPAHFVTNSADGCYATFGSTLKEPVPGFVVWFDLYYDSDRIEVNYNLLNNAITAFDETTNTQGEALDGWILFFQEMGIKFKLSANSHTFSYSANGVNQVITANNATIIQSDSTTLSINGSNSTSIGNSLSAVSTSSNKGVSIIDPFFEYTSPNGWKVDKVNNVLSMLVSPDGCATCESSIGYGDTGRNAEGNISSGVKEFIPSNSGLYALNDLSILPKKFYLSFFEGTQSFNVDIIKNPPNVVLSIDDYDSIGTVTDLFGVRSRFIPQAEDSADFSYDLFEPNQHLFGIDMYRVRSCTTGGIAPVAHNFFMKRPPELNYLAINVYDDLLRPQVLPKYWSGESVVTPYDSRNLVNPDTLSSSSLEVGYKVAAFNLLSYCKRGSIRSFDLGPKPANLVIDGVDYKYGDPNSFSFFADKSFPASFKFLITGGNSADGFFISRDISAYPRDDAHMWVQKLYDAPVDNPMLEYFKRRYESYLNTYTKHKFVGGNARGIGHSLIAQVDSYLESGDAETLKGIEETLDLVLSLMQPSGATHKEDSYGVGDEYTISFMEGYEMHGLLNVLMAVDAGSSVYDKAFALLFGGGVYRPNLPGLVDASITTHFGYKDVPDCETNPLTEARTPRCLRASSSTVTILDPLVVAAYIIKDSDPNRALAIISHLKKYLNGEFGSQPSGIPGNVASYKWAGTSTNRTANILNDMSDTSVTGWLEYIGHIEGAVR